MALLDLQLPFSELEVKKAIFSCASEKAPGPEGFPMLFYQRFWDHLKLDILALFDDFYRGTTDLSDLNASWVCLISKKERVKSAKDLRPISLVHGLTKIISKVLATRLQSVMDALINQHQAAFVRGRYILDNYYCAHILTHHLVSSKQQAAILKLDFERAFDHISWSFLIQLVKARGFGDRWCGWINLLLQSSSTMILLNGVPGNTINCKRGLRQGDPLSPLLFILCVDVLYNMMQRAVDSNAISAVGLENLKVHTLQFADDTLMFFDGSLRTAAAIKLILEGFSESSGLNINYNKSALIPINLPPDQAALLSSFFGCST